MTAGDWTLHDRRSGAQVIDGPCRMTANNTQMLLAAAIAGAGIVYGPTFVFGAHIRRGELVQLLPADRAADLTIQAVYPSAWRIPLRVRRFIDYLAETFGDEPPWDRNEIPWKSGYSSFKSGR
jgi:DNA-binding transcriptional LysR family regulator